MTWIDYAGIVVMCVLGCLIWNQRNTDIEQDGKEQKKRRQRQESKRRTR